MTKRLKLFTHDDLDGVGCAIIGKILAEEIKVYSSLGLEICSYSNINERVAEYLDKPYIANDHLVITDISVNNEVAEKINNMKMLKNLFDHHKSAIELEKYVWCDIAKEEDTPRESGTSMFFNYAKEELKEKLDARVFRILEEFVILVRNYDTWLWKEIGDIKPKLLNDLLYVKGKENFIDDMYKKIVMGVELFNHTDRETLEKRQKEIEEYINIKEKYLVGVNIKGLDAGVVFAEKHISELANTLCERHNEYHLVAVINGNKVSFRTTRNDIELDKLAKEYGGGGHKKASGFILSPEQMSKGLSRIFNDDNWGRFDC